MTNYHPLNRHHFRSDRLVALNAHRNHLVFFVLVATMAALAQSGCAGVASSVNRQLTTSTLALNFNNVGIDSSSVLGVTFSNSGNTSIVVSNVSLSGPGFSVSGVSAGLILSAGQRVILNVTFAPTVIGSVTGSVTVTSNASNSPTSIALSGAGSHLVTLEWDAPDSLMGGYNVYWALVSGGPYAKANTSVIGITTFTDTNVQAGQTYYYVATSVDFGESTYSNEVSATIP